MTASASPSDSDRKYRSLFNSIRDAILVADLERRIVDCNPAFSDLFGYQLAEIRGKETLAVYENEQEFQALGQAIKQNQERDNFFFTVHYQKKNGEVFPGETNVFYQRDHQGNIVGFIGLIRDVSQQRETEEALRQERDLFDRLMETSPVGIVLFGVNCEVTYANAMAENLLCVQQEGSYRLLDVCQQPSWKQILDQVFESGENCYHQQIKIKRSQSQVRLLAVNAAPLRDQQGGISGIVCTLEDVTEKVRQEEELKEQLQREIQTLEEMVTPQVVQATASALGKGRLKQSVPETFQQLVMEYGEILDKALEERVYKVDHQLSNQLRNLAGKWGGLRATPRDLIDLHMKTIEFKSLRSSDEMLSAYTREGRLMLLELMGFLTAYYRHLSLGVRKSIQQDGFKQSGT
jgi:PAS domain S-box-containing protein